MGNLVTDFVATVRNTFRIKNATLDASGHSQSRTHTLQDSDGTLAHLTDIGGMSGGIVPVGRIELSAAATNIAYDGLDLAADSEYMIKFVCKDALGSNVQVSLYYNDDQTDANYTRQIRNGNGTTGSTNRGVDALITVLTANENSVSHIYIRPDIEGYPHALSTCLRAGTTATDTIALQDFHTVRRNTENVTKIDFVADTANSLAAGSYLEIYKINQTTSVGITGASGSVGVSRAYLNSAQNITSGGWQKVNVDTVEVDDNGIWDATNKRFVPNQPGYYQITGYARTTNTGAINLVGIFKNGAVNTYVSDQVNATYHNGGGGSTIIYCNGTTDYIELGAYGVGTKALSVGSPYNYLEVIGPLSGQGNTGVGGRALVGRREISAAEGAQTSIDFTGLDLQADGQYQVLIRGSSNATATIFIYVNGDTTNSHYARVTSGGSPTANPGIIGQFPGRNFFAEVSIASCDSYIRFISLATYSDSSNTEKFLPQGIRYVSSNQVTSLSIASGTSGSIEVGTVVELWKVSPTVGSVLDAAALTYTANNAGDWTGSVDPGNTNNALDQLASRINSVETVGSVYRYVGSDVVASGGSQNSLLVSGLDLATDGTYKILARIESTYASPSDIWLYFNADQTDTNYYRQTVGLESGTDVSATGNNPKIVTLPALGAGTIEITITARSSAEQRARATVSYAAGSSAIGDVSSTVIWTGDVNITSIELHSINSYMSVGSFMDVYKLSH